MKLESKWITHISLIVAFIAAVGTSVQAWVSASQELPISHISANSINELKAQLESRKNNLLVEISNIEQLLSALSISKQQLAAGETKTNGVTEVTNVNPFDSWWLSVVKVFGVYFVLFFSLFISIFALIGDLIALPFGYDFVLLKGIWGWSWSGVTMEWYWNKSSELGSIISLGLVVLAFIFAGVDELKPNKKLNKD